MKQILTTACQLLSQTVFRMAALALMIVVLGLPGHAQGGRADDGTTPLGLQQGAPAGAYALSGFETVNPFNGGLNFALPLLRIGGRGGAQFTMTLKNELKWKVQADEGGGRWIYRATIANWTQVEAGYGPGLMVGRVVGLPGLDSCPSDLASLTRLTFVTPDGTEYEFRDAGSEGVEGRNYYDDLGSGLCVNRETVNRGRVFITRDGTSATFISDADIYDYYPGVGSSHVENLRGYMFMADGTCYRIYNEVVLWIRDRNGNRINFTYDTTNPHRVTHITDSLGRSVDITYGSTFDTITYKGFGSTAAERTRTIEVHYDTLQNLLISGSLQTYAQLFPGLGSSPSSQNPFNPTLLSYVQLPDARRYEFRYNVYGELARVKLPTGGGFEYDWDAGLVNSPNNASTINFGPGNIQVYRRVVERRVFKSFDGTPVMEGRTTYSRPETFSQIPTDAAVRVEQFASPPGNELQRREWHYYYGTSYASLLQEPTDYPKWRNGKEYMTEIYDGGTSPALLQRLETTWAQMPLAGWWGTDSSVNIAPPINTRVGESRTTWTQTNPNQIMRQEFSYDEFNNKTEAKEYDLNTGGAWVLMRRTATTYLVTHPTLGANYTTVNPNLTNPDAHQTIHIRNLPTGTSVFDAAGGEKARTTYEYDNYTEGLTARTNIIGHARNPVATPPAPTEPASYDTGYFTRGNVTQVTNWLLPATPLSVRHQYDIAGNLVKTTDARNQVTNFDFSDRFGIADNEARNNVQNPPELGSAATYAMATHVTNALNQEAYTQYDYYSGKAVNGEDANGTVARGKYEDALDRPTELVIATNLNGLARRTRFVYLDGQKTIGTYSDQTTLNDDALHSEVVYDGLGRTVETHQYAPEGIIKTLQAYDAMGRASKTTNPHRNTSEETYGYSLTTYDGLSRVKTVTTYDKNNQSTGTVTTDYLGNRTTVTDQAGRKRQSVTDGLGRLTQVVEDPGGLGYATSYSYDVLDDLVRVTQAQASPAVTQNRYFMYDSLKRLVRARNPEQDALINASDPLTGNNQWSVEYGYDENGNLLSKRDSRQDAQLRLLQVNYSYDALNRVVTRSYVNDPQSTPAVNFYYDNQALPIGFPTGFQRGAAVGRLVAVLYGGAVSTTGNYQGYDGRGQVTQSLQKTDGQAYPFSYGYNLAGEMTSESYPSGRMLTTGYDTVGRISQVSGQKSGEPNKTYASQMSYAAQGAGAAMQMGNGRWEHTFYNSRLQPTEIGLGTTGSDFSLLRLQYDYGTTSNNGNVLSQTLTAPKSGGGSLVLQQSYSYDALNRLQMASEGGTPGWQQTYDYDRFGNRAVRSTSSVIPNPVLTPQSASLTDYSAFEQGRNRLSTTASPQVLYDGMGNLKRDQAGSTFSYDGESRQVSSSVVGGQSASYVYDGEGRRVKKIVGSVTTVFVYNAAGQLVAEYGSDPVSAAGGGGTSYVTADMLGSTRVVTDGNGAVKARYDYLPYGEELPAAYGGRSPQVSGYGGADLTRQKFTAKERDAESGLDYFLARYYSSAQGRFTSPDVPLAGQEAGDPQTWNLYAYTSNNPLSRHDPDGRRWFYKVENGTLADIQWVDPNKDGSYTSPGEGYQEFVPTAGHPYLEFYNQQHTVAYWFGEHPDGSPDPVVRSTGKTEDATMGLVVDYLIGKAIGKIAERAFNSWRAWRIAKAGEAVRVDPNKLNHIFGKAEHQLDDLVRQFGSQEKAFKAIQEATEIVVKKKGSQGVFTETVKVGTETITVTGKVVGGIVRIGTAYKP